MIKKAAKKFELNRMLSKLATELDVPPSKYKEAENRYKAVGDWLNKDSCDLAKWKPEIYPQGSFALGTVVRPINDEDYDIDAVCLLGIDKNKTSQQQVKKMIGDRLKEHDTYKEMLDPKEGGRRCWTLKYADSSRFHLDVLPAVPDNYDWLVQQGVPQELAKHAICITDKSTWEWNGEWPRSNPKGYREWFVERMKVVFDKQKALLMEKRAEVEEVPDYEVRTPLQQIIQLFKRHRDEMYGDNEDKPISIIITTLAALSYENQSDLQDALLDMIPNMRSTIEDRNGVSWVANPVNPQENFADKWSENQNKKTMFFNWLDKIEELHKTLLTEEGFTKAAEYLGEAYGKGYVEKAMNEYTGETSGENTYLTENNKFSLLSARHRESPQWYMDCKYQVFLRAKASRHGFRDRHVSNNSTPLRRGFSVLFSAETDVPRPFQVYWQVVNTGTDAIEAGDLRGRIVHSYDLAHKERTAYIGSHWVECFIVKNNSCVARSGEFVINIA